MKGNKFIFFVILNLIVTIIIQVPATVNASENPSSEKKRVMFRLKNEIRNNDCAPFCKDHLIGNKSVDAIHKQSEISMIKKIPAGKTGSNAIYVVELAKSEDVKTLIEKYKESGEIAHAEPDHKGYAGGQKMVQIPATTPNDPYFNRQWSLHNDGTFTLSPALEGSDIEMLAAWDIETGDPDLIIAILDSGINVNEPDIQDRFWENPGEIIDNGIDDDGNGYIDDHIGWNVADSTNGVADGIGHGSNIAGIIAAIPNNNTGYTGINQNSKIMVVKALDDQLAGWYSWWIEAINYAVDNGADIINMSMGGDTDSEFLKEAIDYALDNNVPVVACMMNFNNDVPYYPAAYPGVIAVGSTNPDDKRSTSFYWAPDNSGSNYGQHISVIAPGNYIYSISHLFGNYEYYWGGTSMAAPHVTAVASLLMSQNPYLTPAEIKELIELGAEDQVGDPSEDVEGWDQFYGHGRLNAFNSLNLVPTSTPDNENNTLSITMYPNPVKNTLHMKLSDIRSEVQIVDLTGKIIYQQNLHGISHTIATDMLERGIYLIQVSSNNQSVTRKLVKE